MKHTITPEILTAALAGLTEQRGKLDAMIASIHEKLTGGTKKTVARRGLKRKWTISAAGRARIAAAQRLRWAAYHAAKAEKAKR